MAVSQPVAGSTYFGASRHAARLDAIGKDIDQVRAAMRLLGGTSPDDPIRRAGNMLAAISAAHFEEATRLRDGEPSTIAANVAVRRRQRLILGVSFLVLVLFSAIWFLSGDDRHRDRHSNPVTRRDFVGDPHSEQEWMTQTEARFEEAPAQ